MNFPDTTDCLDPLPISDIEVIEADLPQKVKDLLFCNRTLVGGTTVAVRLNLNGRVRKGSEQFFVQTVHEGPRATGKVLGYDRAVTVAKGLFTVSQRARADIAARRQAKFPMAAVAGQILQVPPRLDGVRVRFNPLHEHLFVREDDGRAVRSADEVTIFNNRCYARGTITYWTEEDAPEPLDGIPSVAHYTRKEEDDERAR